MREVRWGGKLEGVTRGGYFFSGKAFGSFVGAVSEGLDEWTGQRLLRGLQRRLERAASCQPLIADLASLSAELTTSTQSELSEQGIVGTATIASAVIHEQPPAGPGAQPVAAPIAAPPRAPAPIAGPTASVDQTALGGIAAWNDDVLPFKPGAATPSAPIATEPGDLAGATGFMAPIEGLDDPLPFEKSRPPELTVEQYASLCVERALNPGQDVAMAQRYRILTEQALRDVDAQWNQRFQTDDELHRRWQEAYTQYEAWLRSRG